MSDIRKIIKKVVPKDLFSKIEPVGHLIESIGANAINGFPAKKMHIIGVTGTNGKTTTTFMIQKMLSSAGYKTALLSTVAYGVDDNIIPQKEHITTAQAGVLQKMLREFADQGVDWVVLETSSHSLAQNRVWGVPYEIAVMTNVTNDHLDYHKTFERYRDAKIKLFKIANRHGLRFGVINNDDPSADLFKNAISNCKTYGLKGGDVVAKNVKLHADYSTYKVESDGTEYDIRVNIPGDFNISNSLAAITVGQKIGLNKEQIEHGIAELKSVEGRMAVVDRGQKYKIIVDFASTPDAFLRFFENVRPVTKGKLVAVFGSAGRRDETKRAVQGEIAAKYADEIVITEEDDRDVDGNEIMAQIASGAKKVGKIKDKDMFLILDRPSAIEFALGRVKNSDDTVVFLGKGHEKTIERADGHHPWNETEEIIKALNKISK